MKQYVLSYITKSQKGMSITVDHACKEAQNGSMDIKASVRHIGNPFWNAVETPQEEAACLVLQMPITRLTRQVIFLHTSPPDERTFLLKSCDILKQLNPESYDIQSHSILSEYELRPRILEQYCLADFASLLQIVYPKNVTLQDPFEDNLEDDPVDPNKKSDHIITELSNGIVIKKQEIP